MTTNRFSILALGLVAVLSVAAPQAQAGQKAMEKAKPSLAEIEKTVRKAMKTFNVPGIALAIVKDDKLVMSKGFGVRKMGSKDKVNPDTLFGIASNTKAFTAAALAILADDGKLNWDDKVSDHLPSFKLHDPYVTREFTIRDMLSHRSGLGLGAGDLMIWPTSNITNDEIIKRMRYLKPVSSFRSEYAYDNLMYVMAGEIVAKVSGMSWHDFVRSRILKPLGMMDTRMSHSRIGKDNRNVASAHAPIDGVLGPVGGDFLEKFSSAGSIASSVNDISKWMKVQLRGGLLSSKGGVEKWLFSESQNREMWSPHTLQGISAFSEEMNRTHFRAYGLGWGLNDHHGYKMVSHTGGIMGMVSQVVLIPELELGMVVLTNQQSGSAFRAITTDIVNRYLGVAHKDWVNVYDERLKARVASSNSYVADLMKNRAKTSKPSFALSDYAQTYKDDWYGDIDVKLIENGKKLEMRFSRTKTLVGHLEHFQHNTFIVRWYDRSTNADAFINFQLTPQGKIDQATMEAVSPLTDFSFDFQDLLLRPKPAPES